MLEQDDGWRRGRRPDEDDDDESTYDDDELDDDDAPESYPRCPACEAALFDDDVTVCPRCGEAVVHARAKPPWVVATGALLFVVFALAAVSFLF